MVQALGKALGVFLILLGGALFAVKDADYRQDAFTEWRDNWKPKISVKEHHPFLLVGAGAVILIYTRAITSKS